MQTQPVGSVFACFSSRRSGSSPHARFIFFFLNEKFKQYIPASTNSGLPNVVMGVQPEVGLVSAPDPFTAADGLHHRHVKRSGIYIYTVTKASPYY